MLSRFGTIPACDGRTDGRTDSRTDVKSIAITCFSIADARKKGTVFLTHGVDDHMSESDPLYSHSTGHQENETL